MNSFCSLLCALQLFCRPLELLLELLDANLPYTGLTADDVQNRTAPASWCPPMQVLVSFGGRMQHGLRKSKSSGGGGFSGTGGISSSGGGGGGGEGIPGVVAGPHGRGKSAEDVWTGASDPAEVRPGGGAGNGGEPTGRGDAGGGGEEGRGGRGSNDCSCNGGGELRSGSPELVPRQASAAGASAEGGGSDGAAGAAPGRAVSSAVTATSELLRSAQYWCFVHLYTGELGLADESW